MDVQATNYIILGLYSWDKGLKNPYYQMKQNWVGIAASPFQGFISSVLNVSVVYDSAVC